MPVVRRSVAGVKTTGSVRLSRARLVVKLREHEDACFLETCGHLVEPAQSFLLSLTTVVGEPSLTTRICHLPALPRTLAYGTGLRSSVASSVSKPSGAVGPLVMPPLSSRLRCTSKGARSSALTAGPGSDRNAEHCVRNY